MSFSWPLSLHDELHRVLHPHLAMYRLSSTCVDRFRDSNWQRLDKPTPTSIS
jgi:hypothetical protein